MSFCCPHCQFEAAIPTADATCARCGAIVDTAPSTAAKPVWPPTESLFIIEALPSEIAAQQASVAQAKLPRPGLLEAIILTWMTYVIVMVAVTPLGSLLSVIVPELVLTGDHLLLLGGMVSSGVMGWCGWVYLSPQAGPRMALFKPRPLHVLIALLLPVLLQIVLLKAETLTSVTGTDSPLAQSISWPDVSSHWYFYYVVAEQAWPLMILIGCVLPACCEEIFFRGLLGRGLVARYGILLGVLLTSALFGVVHFEPWHIVAAFLLGVVLHVVYLCSHSLWTTILLHFVNNVLAYGLLKLQLAGEFSEGVPISWPLAGGAALGAAALLWVLWRTRRRWELGETPPSQRAYVSLEQPTDDARLVSLPWRWGDMAVLAACLLFLASIGKEEGWGWYATREHIARADAALARQDYAQARESYDAALRVAPNHHAALQGRASSALMLADFSAALADADRCLQLSPAAAPAMATRAAALSGLGRSAEALVSARRAVELMPGDSWCESILIQVALEAGDYPLAIDTAWRGSLRADDTFCEATLAWIYLHGEDAAYRNPQLGHDYARRVAKDKNFQDRAALLELAFASRAIGDFGEAVRLYEAAAALSNEDERLIYLEEAEHFTANGPTILKLRKVWHTSWVDDVIPYRCCKKLFVVTPKSHVPELRKERLGLSGYEDWTCEIVTDDELRRRVTALADQLATTPGLNDQLAEKIAWSIGPTLEDVMNSDVELFGKELKLEVAEATALWQAIRQQHGGERSIQPTDEPRAN